MGTISAGGGGLRQSALASSELTGAAQGDVSVLGTSAGVWFAWSDARGASPAAPGAYRSTLAFLVPAD
ncbi:MAG: hypothetical protein RLP09_12195 [Sandaracinaceae bacterium]